MAPRRPRLTRDLVSRLPERVPDPGPIPGVDPPPGWHEEVAQDLLSRRLPDGSIWLFAFGSLMWKRSFAVAEDRPALVRGWHRAFCLGPDTRYRGNPTAPGVMLSLDRGGACRGLALRLPPEGLGDALLQLVRQEPPIPPRWVSAETAAGPLRAFAFVTPRDFRRYCRPGEEELARRLACAVGMLGSMPDYLLSTLEHLRALGLRDRLLERIAARVAAEMEARPPP